VAAVRRDARSRPECGPAGGRQTTIMESCKICHQAADGVVRGKMVSGIERVHGAFKCHRRAARLDRQRGDDLKGRRAEKISGADSLKTIPRTARSPSRSRGTSRLRSPSRSPSSSLQVRRKRSCRREDAGVGRAGAAGREIHLLDSRPAQCMRRGHPRRGRPAVRASKRRRPPCCRRTRGRCFVFYAGRT